MSLTEPEKYLIIAGIGISLFLVTVITLNLFANHLEIPVGIAFGTWFAIGFYLNNIQVSLERTQKTK